MFCKSQIKENKMNEERQTKSLTALLKTHNSRLSAKEANVVMLTRGILAEALRPSTNGTDLRRFKVLTGAGLKFGENVQVSKVKNQTSPQYYENTFSELLTIINGAEADRA